MTDHVERELAAREGVLAAIASRTVSAMQALDDSPTVTIDLGDVLDAYRLAVLASARERVEAVRIAHQGLCSSQMPTAPNHPECDCFSADYNNALDAAARAITEAM